MPKSKSSKSSKKTTKVTKKSLKAREKKITKAEIRPSELTKFYENPIISPTSEWWEAWQTFNPGVILLDSRVHFLYRAIGGDGISRLGYAASSDGFHIDERLPYPVYEHKLTHAPSFNIYSYFSGGSVAGAEDPRIVRVNDEDVLYMTYTACDNGLGVALTSIKVDDFLNKNWNWRFPKLISKPGEIHKNWVIFPAKFNGKYAIFHSLCPQISIAFRDSLEFGEGEYIESKYECGEVNSNIWELQLKGVGAPPIKTSYGWIVFYHAIAKENPGAYKVGVMLLDIDDPTKILYRSPRPILEPEENYELHGFKSGIVYVTGAIIKDGMLLVYYGAADNYIGVAYTETEEFLKSLLKKEKPKLKVKPLAK